MAVVGKPSASSGTMVAVAVDGALEPISQLVALEGLPGPHREEQPFAKPHFIPFDPSGQWVLVPDKSVDRVFVFRCAEGRLTPAAQPFVQAREGAGPRHLVFHPTQPWVYVINELDSTVTAYRFDVATGALQRFQVISALAENYTGNSRASEIEVNRTGCRFFTSTPGGKTASRCSASTQIPGALFCYRQLAGLERPRASLSPTPLVIGFTC